MAAAIQSDYKTALKWIDSGSCVVLDEESLQRLGRVVGLDWVTNELGDRKPIFDPRAMRQFLDNFIWVDAKTRHEVASGKEHEYLMCKYLLVAPSLMSHGSFDPSEETLKKCILVAKRVFAVPAPDKYTVSGQPEFLRNPTVLSGAVARARTVSPQGLRFLDFNKEPDL